MLCHGSESLLLCAVVDIWLWVSRTWSFLRGSLKSNHVAAVQVEQPFEVLALDTYCKGCEASVVAVMETYQGQAQVCGAASTDLPSR